MALTIYVDLWGGSERHEGLWVHLCVHSLNNRFSTELKNDPLNWAFSSQPQATNQFQNNPTYSDTVLSYSRDTWKCWHQTSVHSQYGHGDTNESVSQAAGADALRAAWLEHIPIQQSLISMFISIEIMQTCIFWKERKIYSALTDNCLTYFHHFRIFTVFGECMHVLQYCNAVKVLPKKPNLTKFKE